MISIFFCFFENIPKLPKYTYL